MSYALTFEIKELPPMPNSYIRWHWARRNTLFKKWYDRVWVECHYQKPMVPLPKARLTCVRYTVRSSKQCDYEGIAGSFKPVIDGLIHAGIIEDDNYDVIGIPAFEMLRVNHLRDQKILVRVESDHAKT